MSRSTTVRMEPLDERTTVPQIELTLEREAGHPCDRKVVAEGDDVRIGSNPKNDLCIDDPSVSRFHLRLTSGRQGWSLIDDGSLNGTRVGGLVVRDIALPLPECRIEVGQSVVRVRDLGSQPEQGLPDWDHYGALWGSSAAMRRLFAVLDKVAKSEANVLVTGESGTGKELVANEVVVRGPRAEGPFVIVDCGSVSPTLIESELFGHTRGAFTGAERDRVGAFEAADGGTVFLDEIGELPLEMQPKLLRALEMREVRRIGENRPRKVDVRVIAATNRRLEREINAGRFREDLFFRLSVVNVRVPPLRERVEDIPVLVDVFLSAMRAADKAHLFTLDIIEGMKHYDWPGNVRELRNYVERCVVLEDVTPTDATSLAPRPGGRVEYSPNLETPFSSAKEAVVRDFERVYLGSLMSWAGGNVSRAARRAGMDRMYLHKLLTRHGIDAAAYRVASSSPGSVPASSRRD